MNDLKYWYLKNQTKISWFIIGWMTLQGIEAISHGDYLNAAISFFLVGINWKLD